MELPDPWGKYARLQAISAKLQKIDSNSWGLEEQMNSFLNNPTLHNLNQKASERTRETTARRERSRNRLRKIHQTEMTPGSINYASNLEAREILDRIVARVTPAQWAMIEAVGQGYAYAEIGAQQGITDEAARAQIFRLRSQLQDLRPTA